MRFSILNILINFLFFAQCILLANANAQVNLRPNDIVDLKQIDPTIQVDLMYFKSENFIGHSIAGYKANVCLLTSVAAEGLKKAQSRLQKYAEQTNQHLSLLVHDCYRPQKAVKQFVEWAKDPNDLEMKTIFYPDLPKSKLIENNYISPISGHSRASSVDLTIVEINHNGITTPLLMGTIVDFFGEQSHTAYTKISAQEKKARLLLKDVLTPEFKNYPKEWWHYVLKTEPYPTTFFDFDIETSAPIPPQQDSANQIAIQFSDPALLAVLDHDNRSALSLINIFRSIHEANGLAIPSLHTDGRSHANMLADFKETYGKFVSITSSDVARIIDELGIDWEKDITKTYDSSAAKTEIGKTHRQNGNVTRIFNEKWLTSSIGQFILAGIVNRIDRRDFNVGSCGEVRFIYRLGYVTEMHEQTYASRLPFTVSMVYQYNDDGANCRSIANLWRLPKLESETPTLFAKRILNGPLNFTQLRFKQMEINAQIARFPSDLENVEKRNFAGQAIYLMRIFELKNGVFAAKKLENTPDVQAILKNPELRRELKSYISNNLHAIDTGVYQIPDALLADVAISYSTLGSARLANKPFDLIFNPAEADQLLQTANDSTLLRFANSGRGLIERLNTSTCMGCHQTSSTAGFHFLGHDRIDIGGKASEIRTALDGNRLVLPFSSHVYNDFPRRLHYVVQLAEGQTPNHFHPHPAAPLASWSETTYSFKAAADNMPCFLENETSITSSARWSCDKSHGLSCKAIVKNDAQSITLGQCAPDENAIYAGLSCRINVIEDSTILQQNSSKALSYNVQSFKDTVSRDKQFYNLTEGKIDSSQYNCRPSRIGVPLGRITKACSPSEMSLKNLELNTLPNEICAIVGGKGFEEMAKGYFNSKKFAEGVGRGLLNTCSSTRPCREDYICQELPDFLVNRKFNVSSDVIELLHQQEIGFCTPTYFVYQLRLDGHPNPSKL